MGSMLDEYNEIVENAGPMFSRLTSTTSSLPGKPNTKDFYSLIPTSELLVSFYQLELGLGKGNKTKFGPRDFLIALPSAYDVGGAAAQSVSARSFHPGSVGVALHGMSQFGTPGTVLET